MGHMKKIFQQRKWLLAFFVIAAFLIVLAAEQISSSHNASASIEVAGSAVFAPPPNIAEIKDNVTVLKNLTYGEKADSVLDIYHPENINESIPVILWIHGGGYIGGSKDSRQDYGMALAEAGYLVANINYTLAPEQLYPGPIFQANEAIAYLQQHAAQYGGDMKRLFIGGDSAGAQIASQVAAVISNAELANTLEILPAIAADHLSGALLMCGLFDMQTVRTTEFPNIDKFLAAYTGAEPFESYQRIDELSTVNHITPAYPPVFITVGDADPFFSQSEELVSILQSHQIAVDSVFFEGSNKGLKHEYQYALDTVDAQETLEKTLNFLFVKSQ